MTAFIFISNWLYFCYQHSFTGDQCGTVGRTLDCSESVAKNAWQQRTSSINLACFFLIFARLASYMTQYQYPLKLGSWEYKSLVCSIDQLVSKLLCCCKKNCYVMQTEEEGTWDISMMKLKQEPVNCEYDFTCSETCHLSHLW